MSGIGFQRSIMKDRHRRFRKIQSSLPIDSRIWDQSSYSAWRHKVSKIIRENDFGEKYAEVPFRPPSPCRRQYSSAEWYPSFISGLCYLLKFKCWDAFPYTMSQVLSDLISTARPKAFPPRNLFYFQQLYCACLFMFVLGWIFEWWLKGLSPSMAQIRARRYLLQV